MFWQIFGSFAALIVAALVGFGWIVAEQAARNERNEIEEQLRGKARLLQEVLRGRDNDEMQSLMARLGKQSGAIPTRITLIAADGRVLAETSQEPSQIENHFDRQEFQQAWKEGIGKAVRRSQVLNQEMMYVAIRTDLVEPAIIRVALPLHNIQAHVRDLQWLVWLACGLTALLTLLVAFWVARTIARPIGELTKSAEEIASGRYGRRVYCESGNEIGKLALTFNHMSERLADQFAQIEDDRQQLRAMLGSMVEGVVAIDAEQRILFANERAGQLLEFTVRNAVGRRLWEVVRQRPLQDLLQNNTTEQTFERRDLNWSGQGARSLTVHIARLPGSTSRGAVLVFHDTTELRRLEKLRQEFVANVSHELKTPLAVIQACVETLIDGAVDDPQHRGKFLERIADQAYRLHALILDLLQLARIESEKEAFSREELNVENIVHACVDRHRTLAEGKQQSLEAVAPPVETGPVITWADEEALQQILDNLVNNALKYTPEGGRIRVHWDLQGDEVLLRVEDTGIGIGESDLSRVFERFYRVDKARSREMGGTGLGLSIVKHLAQSMQGNVDAQSQLGKGSVFTVHLPAVRAKVLA
jgi:two-component system phosphate regulon sensor histidine kinase PhoR